MENYSPVTLPAPVSRDFSEHIRRNRQKVNQLASRPIVCRPPLITLNGEGIICRNTVNIIQGKHGSHKSRLSELLCSLLLRSPGCGTDFLGFCCEETDTTVAYVDTERNVQEQFPLALQGVRQKAGLLPTRDLDRLVPLSLIEVHRKERLDYLRQFVEQICAEVPGPKFLLLDVITDCLSDFNAASETLELFDYLNRLINDFQLTILLVIHENPGTEKARGHTGTEAQNKASTILQIGFERGPKGEETELIKLRVLKLRAGKRPEPLFLRYCPERRGLALAGEDQLEEVLRSRRLKADVDDVAFDLGKFLEGERESRGSCWSSSRVSTGPAPTPSRSGCGR